ncbi:MAG TPA: HlyD family type I secretion periplasmic adaptor subunit [Sedimenticola thiotaurini]|uniref:Membrane fusion protein (MFP) family protein n=1 Tax=Sedimenticola thiotaurini TaxID=1543721 RepID=A0A831RKW5_9GAMM|nr:HlyD family type I secretion periplasmic adaptor subunit [Sedimenticola thiotaurini]
MKEEHLLFTSRSSAGVPRARARFLTQAIQLEEQQPSSLVRFAILFTVLVLVAAIYWASMTRVSEVAIARGEVIPAGMIHDIQHLEGGIVSEIAVRDGDQVEKGQLLLSFAPPASLSEYEQTLVRKAALEMETERLAAILERRKPDFGDAGKRYPRLALRQMTLYRAQMASQESELRVIDAQIRQRRTELSRQQNQAKSIRRELELLREQVRIRSRLAERQVVARTELLDIQSRQAETQREQRTIEDNIVVAQSALDEALQRRQELVAQFNEEIELQAGEAAEKLAEVEQSLVRLKDRVNRLDIHAPVSGIVQGLSITRINAVVEPGQVIMQIVPVDDELIVEARISPNDIGHVHRGQEAEVKVDSYDSARFGSVAGVIRRISPSTYLDERREPYYRAEIELERSWVGDPQQKMEVIPGMTVVADVKTGSKTLLDYLLKPISRGFGNAFRER